LTEHHGRTLRTSLAGQCRTVRLTEQHGACFDSGQTVVC
jgi:hypothetical protein